MRIPSGSFIKNSENEFFYYDNLKKQIFLSFTRTKIVSKLSETDEISIGALRLKLLLLK